MNRNRTTVFGRLLAVGLAFIIGMLPAVTATQNVEAATVVAKQAGAGRTVHALSYNSIDEISNILYAGDILRSDSFAGYITSYNGGASAVVIHEGINRVKAELTPLKGNGKKITTKDLREILSPFFAPILRGQHEKWRKDKDARRDE